MSEYDYCYDFIRIVGSDYVNIIIIIDVLLYCILVNILFYGLV